MYSSSPSKLRAVFALTLALIYLGSVTPNLFGQRRGKAAAKSSSRAAGLVEEGDKFADENKWAEAIDVYKVAIRLDPNYSAAHGGLGDAYFNTGNWEQALASYKEQARLAPNDAQAQFDLGYAYNAMGRHGEAFAPLVKATSLDPSFAEAHYSIGYAYSRGSDFEKSINFFKSAIRLKPDYADAYYGLALALARLGKADAADETLKKLATLNPRLAKKLEKDIQNASTAPTNTPPPASVADVQTVSKESANPTAKTSAAPSAQADKPVARLMEPVQTQSKPQPVVKTQPANPQTSEGAQAPPPVQQSEPTSRQLVQVAKPPQEVASVPKAKTAPPNSVASQLGQITSLPVSAKRWALVIGVDKYMDPQISPLKGSDNDARMIADALVRYAGFPQDQVILLSTAQPMERQPTRVNILRRLSNLSTAVPKDGLLLISFAGHGMERGGQAFLLPSDSQISDQVSFLEETAISLNRVKDRVKETGVGQVVMLLDACRNDPGGRADAPNALSTAYTSAFNFDVRNREVQAFATVYATGIGQRAYEYTEKKQGYFSWAVVEGLKGAAANDKGEITLSQLVKYVQENVPKRIAVDLGSTKQQRPFAIIEGYRADELVMAVTNNASMANSPSTPNIATVDPAAIELAYWDTIKNSNNPEDFKSYLEKYPDGQFASLAKSRSQPIRSSPSSMPANVDAGSLETTYWNAIKDSRNPSDFRAYVTKFPGGLFVEIANNRVAMLESEIREREGAKRAASEAERARNTRLFDLKDGSGTEGTLMTTPGSLSFEVKKRSEKNDKKNFVVQCTQIRRVEQGKSAFQPPHVNLLLHSTDKKELKITFYTSRGGQGLFINTPVVDITADVVNGIIEACKMSRVTG
ncbi:MAG TPA: tetratricopeptide repeat protein [Pyrinomonadaceae bacterium]|nr:tetratricopeptide repeat protein [Pyrinomonadaceae bacterium]